MNSLFAYSIAFDRATRNQHPDRAMTLAAWHQRAVLTREALQEARKLYQADLEELQTTYTPQALKERRADSDKAYASLVETAKKKIGEDLERVLEGKQKRFTECNGAPSESDLRLLTALSMRDSLSPAEVAEASGKFGGNLQSLRLLRDISRRSGVGFPDVGDPDEFSRQIDDARKFALSMLDTLDVPAADLPYRQLSFWTAPGEGEARYFFGMLDDQGFTAQQVSAATTAQKQATEVQSGEGKIWARVDARGGESLYAISEQFHVSTKDIRDVNPDMDLSQICAGDRFLVPSTRFSIHPDSGGVQPDQVVAVPAPSGEQPGAIS